jgi:uncharacterized protein (TIGR02145 family)
MKTNSRIWFCPLSVLCLVLILANSCKKEEEIITDVDGNVYTSVTIGTQVWMVENLKTTKFNDGTQIPFASNATEWQTKYDQTPFYCWYDDNIANKDIYGALYKWYSVKTGKLCPTGWHVPSDTEWETLATFLGGDSIAGGKLKETGTTHWLEPNTGATNETDYTALPGGTRGNGESIDFLGIGSFGNYWSSTESLPGNNAWGRGFGQSSLLSRGWGWEPLGYSVRCLKDN